MKKFSLLFLLCIVFVSCEQTHTYSNITESTLISMTRTYDEAFSYAEQALDLVSGLPTKSGNKRVIENHEVIVSNQTKGNYPDTLMYVFNFSENSGFSAISANKSQFPIVAITENGHFDLKHLTGIPPVDSFFELYIKKLENASIATKAAPPGIITLTNIVYSDSVGPFINVNWGQTGIYGMFCPNLISGCMATAIAQIMSYHKHPTSFISTVIMGEEYTNGEMVSLDWNNINTHINSHSNIQSCTPSHKQIAALMRETGDLVQMDYSSPTSSSAIGSKAEDAFEYFGYAFDNYSFAYTPSIILSLKENGPVFMSGVDSNAGGHAWVADGYVEYVTTIDSYENGELIGSFPKDDRHVLHINWGWDGDCNGYFHFGNYDTGNADTYDGTSYSDYNFQSNLKALTNIKKH